MQWNNNNITEDNCQQLGATQFKDRFPLVGDYQDKYNRPYYLTTDAKTGKRAIVREYYESQIQFEEVFKIIKMFQQFNQINEICRFLSYAYGKSRNKMYLAFDYFDKTLKTFLEQESWEQNNINYEFFLGLFFDVLRCITQLSSERQYSEITTQNILIDRLETGQLFFKLYIDERGKQCGSLTNDLLKGVYFSPQKLDRLKGSDQDFDQQKMFVYEIGLLILDLTTLQIKDSLYTMLVTGNNNQPHIDINQNVINTKLQMLQLKFKDDSLFKLVSLMLKIESQRPTLQQIYDEASLLLSPIMNGSIRLTKKSNTEIRSSKVAKSRSSIKEQSQNHNLDIEEGSIIQYSVSKLENFLSNIYVIEKASKIKQDLETFYNNLQKTSNIQNIEKDGVWYYGQINGQNKDGQGIIKYSDGSMFFGRWVQNRKRDGTCIFANGECYVGKINGKKQGYGTYYYKNGNVYQGNWQNDQRHGHGTNFYNNGEKYIGEWQNNKKHGQGQFYNSKQEIIYQGSFVDGHKNGKCYLVLKDGSKLYGDWQKVKIGEGKLYLQNGDFYEGNCNAGEKQCYGTLHRQNYEISGQFVNGSISGLLCVIKYKNGDIYQGSIQKQLRNGKGKYTYQNGDVFDGLWQNNNKISGVILFADGRKQQLKNIFSKQLSKTNEIMQKLGSHFQPSIVD